jgi:hypothetical protein
MKHAHEELGHFGVHVLIGYKTIFVITLKLMTWLKGWYKQ